MQTGADHRPLHTHEYETLQGTTRTHRESLVLRLCAEAGLRAGEITRLTPADVTGGEAAGEDRQFVTVHEANGETRTAFLPASLAHEFWLYVRSNDVARESPVVDVSARRIQMIVKEIAERAAERTGRTTFEGVTPTVLRQYFAQQLLIEEGVDARVVAAVGGWEGIDGLLAPLPAPTREEIASAFDRKGAGNRGRPDRVGTVVETLFGTVEEILDASERAELEQLVCDRVTGDCYRAAWILDWDRHREQVTVQRHAGESAGRFDGAANTSIVRRALQIGKPIVGPDDPGPTSDLPGRGLLAAVPLQQDETTYGALVVRADGRDAFEEDERAALASFGRQIGSAICALERKQVLVGGTVLEVSFRYDDADATLVGLARQLGCELTLEGAVAGEQGVLCFARLRGTAPKAALEAADDRPGIEDPRLVRSSEDGGLLELELTDGSPLLTLTDRGATVTDLRIEGAEASLTCELAPDVNLRSIHDDLHARFPSLELRRKQEREATTDALDAQDPLTEYLTEKQRSVLQAAYHAGYFEWPRGSTAEDLADSMDVSSPTLHNHLRKAQQKLLKHVLETG